MLMTLQNTPLWVYAILLVLVYYGLKAFSPSRKTRRTMLWIPAALIAWSLYSMNPAHNPTQSLACWLGALLLGSALAWMLFSDKGVALDESQNALILPGTWKVLALYLLFFAVNYYFGYQGAVHPELASTPDGLASKAAASGFVCGLIGTRSLKYYRLLRILQAQSSRVNTP